jgi:chorismate synthase
MLRFLTAGESHGQGLMAILDGVPAGLVIDFDKIQHEMACRQKGYGRGARQKIEVDQIEIIGGVRHGITSGAPLALSIQNRDWDNWQHVMSVQAPDKSRPEVAEQIEKKSISRFRPGHADLAGTFKFRQRDVRDVLERSSARETAARVAVGAVCQTLLRELDIKMVAQVVQVGNIKMDDVHDDTNLADLEKSVLASEMFCPCPETTEKMKALIKEKWQEGDSLGGVVEVLVDGLPIGLGSYTQWDKKLDGQLAQAIMSIQAIKAVEIGDGVAAASLSGSSVHDPLYPAEGQDSAFPFVRTTNRAGGIEGGMSNGSRLRVRAYMKPLPTLRKGLPSVSHPDFKADTAHFERSDVCAISAASIVAKAMVSFILAKAILDKFGGDTMFDLTEALSAYRIDCKTPMPAEVILPSSSHLPEPIVDEAELE